MRVRVYVNARVYCNKSSIVSSLVRMQLKSCNVVPIGCIVVCIGCVVKMITDPGMRVNRWVLELMPAAGGMLVGCSRTDREGIQKYIPWCLEDISCHCLPKPTLVFLGTRDRRPVLPTASEPTIFDP